ncbi:hypothetical protein IFO70_33375 [Phormidium tenue FACHB-886]|nr:hypothetical protein [Phormidium tenue FACHB-886]
MCAAFTPLPPASAQTCNYYAGRAVDGQSINVDLCSISTASYRSADFVYYLGSDRIQSQANCENASWTTFPEREVHRPQSQATQNMLDAVCSRLSSNSFTPARATVFAPPSNVRTAANGEVLCSIKQQMSINIYGSTGEWYYTDACGTTGVIHSSQISF